MSNTRLPLQLTRTRPLVRRLADMVHLIWTAVAALWRRLTFRRRKWPVLPPYVDLNTFTQKLLRFALPFGLAFFCLVYGFYFALTAPYLLVPFAAPVLLLALLSVWALPTSASPPTRTMEFFFATVFVGLVLWPNYLALALPGLPWLTMIRLTGIPMALLFLVSLSMSVELRRDLGAMLRATSPIWTIMLVLIAVQFLTLGFAKQPGAALQRSLIQQVNWTAIFLIAVYICRRPGAAQRYINLLMMLAIPIVVVALVEASQQRLLWAEHVPSFLKVDDPTTLALLNSHVRLATGLYRAKATFSTALGLGEFMALLTPFAIHFAVGPYARPIRILGLLGLPLIFFVVRLTDARLGVVGILASFLLYSLFWALVRFRRTRGDLPSATIVYSYPTLALLFMGLVNASNRLNAMVFGGGAQAASDAARQYQVLMGVPKVLRNPIGHGAGNAGDTMGYGAGQFVTVDNYYLTLALDYGVLGLTAFLALFLTAITYGARYGLIAARRKDPELLLLLPLTVCLASFLVIKSVFSQPDNHPIIFMVLGMIVALSYRVMTGEVEPDIATGSGRDSTSR